MAVKLQIALDEMSMEEGLRLVGKVRDSVDIIEIGTPFILQEGMHAVREFRRAFPEKEILADMKIMDAGEYEARIAFEAGADYATVLGVTDDLTILGCLRTAQEFGKRIVVDMICVEDIRERIRALEEAGVADIAVHTGVDQQAAGRTPLDDLKLMRACSQKAKISVAGGINRSTLPAYLDGGADVIIVGGGIAHAADPAAEARALSGMIRK